MTEHIDTAEEEHLVPDHGTAYSSTVLVTHKGLALGRFPAACTESTGTVILPCRSMQQIGARFRGNDHLSWLCVFGAATVGNPLDFSNRVYARNSEVGPPTYAVDCRPRRGLEGVELSSVGQDLHAAAAALLNITADRIGG